MRDNLATDLNPIALWNAAIAAMAQGIVLPGRGQAVAELTDLDPDIDAPTFVAVTATGPVYLQPRNLPLGPLTQSTLDWAALSRLPVALADAVLSLALDRLLTVGGDALRRFGLALTRCAAGDMVGQETALIRVDGGWGALAEVLIRADRATLSALTRTILPGAARGHWPEAIAAQIILPCSLRLVGPCVTVARLRHLSVGDVLLAFGTSQWLCAPHARFGLSHDGTNWTISEVSMTDDLPAMEPGPIPEAGDIGDVPVRLSFQLAERTMTLAELQGLTKGAILPFAPEQTEAGQAVRLLANGRLIGDGHIVEVDGQPALRIARLFGQ